MDYVYYPMVGSSTKLWWWCFAIFITFFISGFWHGAAWTYVFSFSIFGFYLVICTLKDKRQRKFEKKYGLKKKEWWLWLNRIITFFLVMIALVFFRSNNLPDAFDAIVKMFSCTLGTVYTGEMVHIFHMTTALIVLFIAEYIIEYKKIVVSEKNYMIVYSITSIGLLSLILCQGVFDGSQFIYFQF
jgi:D-alanyl-lipoteichoic acid acyltransferase DltB (MBOAT superfamily)